jgi:hypothetical protein
METAVQTLYAPASDGGGTFEMRFADGRPIATLPLDRLGALKMAASILGAAGVTEATFSDGVLHAAGRP